MNIFNIKRNLLGASLIASLAIGASVPAFAATNLILNGEFTSPAVGHGFHQGTVPDWTNLASDNIEVGYASIYGLSTSINATGTLMELDSHIFGDVEQVVTGLKIGKTYSFSFEYGGRTGVGAQKIDAYFGSSLLATETATSGAWTLETFTVTATSASEAVRFLALNTGINPSAGNEITNVSLSAVPEPSTWAMMLSGFAGLSFLGYRRRKSAAALV